MNLYSLLCIKPNFVPKEIINVLLENKSTYSSPALVVWDDKQEPTDYRKTKWLNLPPNIHSNLYQSIHQIHEEHLKPIYNSTLKTIEGPQFLRYDVGDHYDKHNDSESYEQGKLKRVVNRDISILLYLNDDYEGGQIEFNQIQLTLRPKTGMLLAFPSYIEFEHKVHPVTNGTRYSLVSWINTEKRIYARPYDNDARNLQQTWILNP
jgi:predicted 2-oxoglutarate/Fe(II)-dependent dioxygenase YbiX